MESNHWGLEIVEIASMRASSEFAAVCLLYH